MAIENSSVKGRQAFELSTSTPLYGVAIVLNGRRHLQAINANNDWWLLCRPSYARDDDVADLPSSHHVHTARGDNSKTQPLIGWTRTMIA